MKVIFLTLLLLIGILSSTNAKESLIMELVPEQFYDLISQNQKVILNFYDTESKFSQTFNPIFEEVANQANSKNLDYKFAKINASMYEEFSETFKISDIPTIVYIHKTSDDNLIKVKYTGQKSKKALLSYLTKKKTYKARELIQYSKFLQLIKKSKKFIILLGDKSKNEELLNNLIQSSLDLGIYNIFWSNSDEFYEKYGVEKGKIEIIYHTNDNERLDKGALFELSKKPYDLSIASILHLIKVYTRPPIMEFSTLNIRNVFGDSNNLAFGVLVFNPRSNSTDHKSVQELANSFAEEKRRELPTFYLEGPGSKKANNFMSSFAIQLADIPAFAIYQPEIDNKSEERYILRAINNVLTKERLYNFVDDFFNKKLTPFIISEPIPDKPTDSNGIYKIVGTNFKSIITYAAKNKHALVNFCTTNERCNEFEERFIRVKRKLQNNKNLIFGRIDSQRNEFEGLGNDATPTLVFFPDTDEKIRSGKIYDGLLTTANIIKFVAKCYKESGQSLKIEALDDDFDEDQREKFSPIKSKEDKPQEEEGEGEGEGYGESEQSDQADQSDSDQTDPKDSKEGEEKYSDKEYREELEKDENEEKEHKKFTEDLRKPESASYGDILDEVDGNEDSNENEANEANEEESHKGDKKENLKEDL